MFEDETIDERRTDVGEDERRIQNFIGGQDTSLGYCISKTPIMLSPLETRLIVRRIEIVLEKQLTALKSAQLGSIGPKCPLKYLFNQFSTRRSIKLDQGTLKRAKQNSSFADVVAGQYYSFLRFFAALEASSRTLLDPDYKLS